MQPPYFLLCCLPLSTNSPSFAVHITLPAPTMWTARNGYFCTSRSYNHMHTYVCMSGALRFLVIGSNHLLRAFWVPRPAPGTGHTRRLSLHPQGALPTRERDEGVAAMTGWSHWGKHAPNTAIWRIRAGVQGSCVPGLGAFPFHQL